MKRALSTLAMMTFVMLASASAFAQNGHAHGHNRRQVPELSGSGSTAALALLGGVAAILHGRRRKRD